MSGLGTTFFLEDLEDGTFDLLGVFYADNLMDGSYTGETAEDVFMGARSSIGIESVSMINFIETNSFFNRFEIDHVQFGYAVPEPSAQLLACCLCAITLA